MGNRRKINWRTRKTRLITSFAHKKSNRKTLLILKEIYILDGVYYQYTYSFLIFSWQFRDLFNNEDTRQIAFDTYEQNKASYMSVAQKKLMKILKLQKK